MWRWRNGRISSLVSLPLLRHERIACDPACSGTAILCFNHTALRLQSLSGLEYAPGQAQDGVAVTARYNRKLEGICLKMGVCLEIGHKAACLS